MAYAGEKHAILLTTRGFKRANYCGPGTQLDRRLREGSAPVSNMDKICQRHDMAYEAAKSPDDIKSADAIMVRQMDADPWIPAHEKIAIGSAMKVKMLAEKLTGQTFFAGKKFPANLSSRACMKAANIDACLQAQHDGAKQKTKVASRRRKTRRKTKGRPRTATKKKRAYRRFPRY